MDTVAEFERVFPGLFRGGAVGWRYFWALVFRMGLVRARERLQAMSVEFFGQALAAGAKDAVRALERATRVEAGITPPPPNEYERMTARGQREYEAWCRRHEPRELAALPAVGA